MNKTVTETEYSRIITIGKGNPTLGIVGLCHGDEVSGGVILDELADNLSPQQGTVTLIYAHLPASKANKRYIEVNLNRIFPGNETGKLEERIAFHLQPVLSTCDYVVDIHSTSEPTTPFAISTIDNENFSAFASETGLGYYVIMTPEMARGKSLIDYVNQQGGQGISFEAGSHTDQAAISTAREVIQKILRNKGFIIGDKSRSSMQKFIAMGVVRAPTGNFTQYRVDNFKLLPAGVPYGNDGTSEYSLEEDCYPFLYSERREEGRLFIKAHKVP